MATTQPNAAELRAWTAFLNAQASLLRRLEAELIESQDMTLAEFDVLIQLGMAPDRRLRMTELSDRVRLSHSGVTRLVDRLTKAGLVERTRRARPVRLRGVREHFGKRLTATQLSAVAEALEPLARDSRSASPGAR